MSTNNNQYSCQACQSSRAVLFCTDCTNMHCNMCVDVTTIEEYYCGRCKNDSISQTCGVCGTLAKVINEVDAKVCPICRTTNLGEPEVLLSNLSSEFFSVITKVNDILPSLSEIHRKFDFFVTLIRLCRLANLVGFPQIEQFLGKCAIGLEAITNRGIDQLQTVRKEALFDLRHLNNFQNLSIDHYRNAQSIVNNTSKSIQQIMDFMHYWIDEVKSELDKLMQLADPMRQHYELLSEVTRYLPDGVCNVVSVIPPLSMQVKYKKQKRKLESYLIFGEDALIVLPVKALNPNKQRKIINGIQYPYTSIESVKETYSALKGCQLTITSSIGQIKMTNSPLIITGIKEYFDMIFSGQPFIVGSPKDVIEIENNGPDKNKFKRATVKFIDIFRKKLFGSPVQEPENDPHLMKSMTQIKDEYDKLLSKIKEIDFMAKNLQIKPQEYHYQRDQFKNHLENIQDSIGSMGGYLVRNSLENYRLKETNPFDNL